MDALYILGKGSPFNNAELKYSLRSLERHGKNVSRVIIIGEKPDFLDYSKIEHYPFRSSGPKDFVIASKIMYACQSGIVEGDFLFLNDDFFFTRNFDAETYPYFQKGQLLIGEPKTGYQQILGKTRDYLIQKGKKTTHFDVHVPIIYNADKFLSLKEIWADSRKSQIGMVVKSLYCNMHGITGPAYHDVKIKDFGIDAMANIRKGNVFSCYDSAISGGLGEWLKTEFTNKSKWEL